MSECNEHSKTKRIKGFVYQKIYYKKDNKKNYFLYLRPPLLGALVERQWRTIEERVLTDNFGCFFLRDMNWALVRGLLALRDEEAFFLAGIF